MLCAGIYGCKTTSHATISFNSNGGEEIDNVIDILPNELTTSKKGYVFDGWYLDNDFSTPIKYPFCAKKDTTLYAKWVTPKEMYLRNDGSYTYRAKIDVYDTEQDLGHFWFRYDNTTDKVVVSGCTAGILYPISLFDYEYPISDISAGKGFFRSDGSNDCPISISKTKNNKVEVSANGTIKYFDLNSWYTFGSSTVTIKTVKEYYNAIGDAFYAYYSYCFDKFSFLVY